MPSDIALSTAFLLLSTTLTAWFLPIIITWHKKTRKLLLVDMNKPERPKVPGLGGLAIVAGFIIGATTIIALKTLFSLDSINLELLYPGLLTISVMAFIGFIDDVLILSIRPAKIILAFLASIPMISTLYFINFSIDLPFLPEIHLGLIYPLLIIPLLVIFGSNAINIMADFDGLSPGNSLIVTAALFICGLVSNNATAMFIFAGLFGPLLVLYFYNRYPSKVFCGNAGTLFIGSTLAIGALIGNIKLPFLIIMLPYVIHFLLQQRRSIKHKKLLKERPRERGIIKPDGSLESEYQKSYGLTHFVMIHLKKITKITERKLVHILMMIEFIFALFAIIIHLNRV